jgi:hypothetical protein
MSKLNFNDVKDYLYKKEYKFSIEWENILIYYPDIDFIFYLDQLNILYKWKPTDFN